jgi:hypothetical protein
MCELVREVRSLEFFMKFARVGFCCAMSKIVYLQNNVGFLKITWDFSGLTWDYPE